MKAPSILLSLGLLAQSVPPGAAQTAAGGASGSAPFAAITELPLSGAPLNSQIMAGPGISVSLGRSLLPALDAAAASIGSVGRTAPAAPPAAARSSRSMAAPRPAAQGALGVLAAAESGAAQPAKPDNESPDVSAGRRAFDGVGTPLPGNLNPSIEPAFEPPTLDAAAPPAAAAQDETGENKPKRPYLNFQPHQKSALLANEKDKAVYAAIKLVKDTALRVWDEKTGRSRKIYPSKAWWNKHQPGVKIDIVVKDENVFGRPTTVTQAETKPISKLSLEDFKGVYPAYQLKAGVRVLRKALVAELEKVRARFSPHAAAVDSASNVRVVKFKPFIDLYRQVHGKDAVFAPEPAAARTPLKAEPKGKLKDLSLFLPRAVYLDLDLFEGPVPKELLSDMAKLQRTGVYFVAFSRKPYAAAGSLRDKLIRQLSSYQQSVLFPIRFMAVTDDGAVISEFPKSGSPAAVDVLSFSQAELDVLRDAVGKAAESIGVSPRAFREVRQPPLDDHKDDFFGRLGAGKPQASREDPDPRVRFEVRLPSLSDESYGKWERAFHGLLETQGLKLAAKAETLADGSRSFSAAKTTLEGSLARLERALGEKFGLYMNPGDALVLSKDPALLAANPKSLDVAKLTGLAGPELVENALGLMLGEHREDREGDLSGSASRMAQFSRDRRRYLSESMLHLEADEQNINFFSGHAVHAANDWLVWSLQNGRRPTREEYEANLRERWNAGLREFKPVGLPPGETSEDWLRESVTRGLNMYDIVLRIHDRGEVLIGTEIPNFFVPKDYARRSGELKRRYVLHTIFDFVTLRPDPANPGHATVVIYDFKTGPAKTIPKLNKDVQALTYALFAHEKWVGEEFPAPYLVGGKSYHIDAADVVFIYSMKEQPTAVDAWALDGIRKKIIGTLNRIHAAERKMLGDAPKKPARKKAAGKASKR